MTDEMEVEAIAKVIWTDFSARIGGEWPGKDSQLVAVIQCMATARRALEAVRALRPAGEDKGHANLAKALIEDAAVLDAWEAFELGEEPPAPLHYAKVAQRLRAASTRLASPIIDAKVAGDDALRAAAIAGWNACRKSIYAVCEDVQNQAADPNKVSLAGTPDQKMHEKGFWLGYSDAGKSIARGFGAMEALDDDNLTAALRALATPTAANASEGDGRETGWLIELRGQRPTWFQLADGDNWTDDSTKALRFARKADAESYIEEIGWTEAFASEHEWLDPRPASPDTKEQARG